jgi:hypothetical protein
MLVEDIETLRNQLDMAEGDARSLVDGLTEEQGCWRADAGSWSVAQCLDHIAISNEVYLRVMKEPAVRARAAGRLRRQAALPGFLGRKFAATMEPPVKASKKMKAPQTIRPGTSCSLVDAFAHFLTSHAELRHFLGTNADLDLAAIRFPNPFVPVIRFSVATGLHVLAAHERRHLWQGWQVRRAAHAGSRTA